MTAKLATLTSEDLEAIQKHHIKQAVKEYFQEWRNQQEVKIKPAVMDGNLIQVDLDSKSIQDLIDMPCDGKPVDFYVAYMAFLTQVWDGEDFDFSKNMREWAESNNFYIVIRPEYLKN